MTGLVQFGGRVRECEVVKTKSNKTEVKIAGYTVVVFSKHVTVVGEFAEAVSA